MAKIIILFLSLIVTFAATAKNKDLCAQVAEHLDEGDLIFLDIDNKIFENVAIATKTWTSHVGVAVYNEGWFVVESAVLFSRETPLCKYLSRTEEERVEVRRLSKMLTQDQVEDLKFELSTQMGILYDTGFNYEGDGLFCSKLVYNAFKNVLQVEVGEIKTFRQVFAENPEGSLTFWQWWFLGSIPWERRTVTPKDQLIDADFFTVFQHGELSASY